MIEIKRGSTPTIEITIHTPFEGVKEVSFIFKDKPKNGYGREILRKEYKDNIPIKEDEDTTKQFCLIMKLDADETLRFPVDTVISIGDTKVAKGKAYMDTRVMYSDGTVPPTRIIEVGTYDTFFEE